MVNWECWCRRPAAVETRLEQQKQRAGRRRGRGDLPVTFKKSLSLLAHGKQLDPGKSVEVRQCGSSRVPSVPFTSVRNVAAEPTDSRFQTGSTQTCGSSTRTDFSGTGVPRSTRDEAPNPACSTIRTAAPHYTAEAQPESGASPPAGATFSQSDSAEHSTPSGSA
ncbi:hypothetical protein MHYP_G00285120 [Metynnis hypsauchen]